MNREPSPTACGCHLSRRERLNGTCKKKNSPKALPLGELPPQRVRGKEFRFAELCLPPPCPRNPRASCAARHADFRMGMDGRQEMRWKFSFFLGLFVLRLVSQTVRLCAHAAQAPPFAARQKEAKACQRGKEPPWRERFPSLFGIFFLFRTP